jgi:hypothetical protein
MNTIKKYWQFIIAGAAGIFIGARLLFQQITKYKLKKTSEQLIANTAELNKLKGKTERVAEEKQIVVNKIEEATEIIENLETAKQNIPNKTRTVSESKQNIINKTKRK